MDPPINSTLLRKKCESKLEAPWGEVTARDIVAEVDVLSWRCRKRSPFHKASAWFFCAGSNRQVAHPSHLMVSQLGFFVPGEPRTGDTRRNPRDDRKENLRTEYLEVQFRNFLIELFRQYAEVNIKWSQSQACTIRRPVACITGDITSGIS